MFVLQKVPDNHSGVVAVSMIEKSNVYISKVTEFCVSMIKRYVDGAHDFQGQFFRGC